MLYRFLTNKLINKKTHKINNFNYYVFLFISKKGIFLEKNKKINMVYLIK